MHRFICILRLILAVVATLSDLPSANADAAEISDGKMGAIVVRVVNDAGVPQTDVAIRLFCYDSDWRCYKNLSRDRQTDRSGIVTYDWLPTDRSYVVCARTQKDQIGYKRCSFEGGNARREVDLTIGPRVIARVRVRDSSGSPVAGASIWTIKHTGRNGHVFLDWQSLEAFGLSTEPSDRAGELSLPRLPAGTVDVHLIHPEYAPCQLQGIALSNGLVADATLDDGVKLTLCIENAGKEPIVGPLVIDLRRRPLEHPSSLIGRLPELTPDGTVELTVAGGKFGWLRLMHPDYVVTPIYAANYGHTVADGVEAFELQPGQDRFEFRMSRKVKVHGRVVNAETGEPVAEASIQGKLRTNVESGPFEGFADEWCHAGWGETGYDGKYEIELAAGLARVSFKGRGLMAQPDHYDVDVAPDETTTVPDFLVGPVPKVRGVVRDQNGAPLPGAVVRFRGSMLTVGVQPVLTDEDGRFELAPPRIPEDFQTHERIAEQTVVAFHPYKPLFAEAQIRWDDAKALTNVVLPMQPQEFESLAAHYPNDLSPWQRGIVPADEKERLTAISLAGQPAPELDGAHWLNTGQPAMSLADFRGQYVLLQFWTTWCGPCHSDMPSLRLIHDLYGDKGLVVVGVHDNSRPLETIKDDVAKEQLSYPIVVDQPDGRILARYEEHGISGFPSYVLIGPDGKVIQDETVPGPGLGSFKMEIIRQLLMSDREPTG